ncbi:glycoside hydrolase family 25 protein [Ethanoligenens harbinense]|uniref:Glycoside hydrolase family 25 n=1 Tax=Ethanoligenens harbinense (strain DSM 18485 / JCM 12961 / CGMCC 1.5033 / YUAN-3) TaxID=663278 RepID=E6U902_ETHHY|nr:glycoside hydrolase family 25 protein [Ethanoligenens harbinense]ADU26066.1 glycoside hydrolase family 25 [Ethanoligenens harbinense YUAN-3]
MTHIIKRAAVGALMVVLLSATVMAVTPPGGAVFYHGVDIYHGTSDNGQINWNRLAQTQNFVYIKTDEGISYVDRMWTVNRTAAAAHGMAWGPYHFLRLNSDPVEQADSFWARIRGTGYSLVPAVDVESYDGQQSAASMRQIIRVFITEFQRVSGITPVLYTYTAYANDILHGQFTDCPLWLADYRGYAGDVVGWGAWDAWQYSERGQIDAIANGKVDLDYATAEIFLAAPAAAIANRPVPAPSCEASDYYEVPSLPQAPNSRAGADFYIRDRDGARISSHQVDAGDPLIILSVDYATQLTEVLYPNYAADGWFHGYIVNDEAHLHNTGWRQWKNGRSDEPAYTVDGEYMGTLSPYEHATILKRCADGRTLLLYDTARGSETKSGYVRYPGK